MEDSISEFLTVAQINTLSDAQRMQYLKEKWSISVPLINGILRERNEIWWLTPLHNKSGSRLQYPLADLGNDKEKNVKNIYVGRDLSGFESGQYVEARFQLAVPFEREKNNNPLHLSIDPKSIRSLKHIPLEAIAHRADGSVDLDETLYRAYFEQNHQDVTSKLRDIKEQIQKLEGRAVDLKASNINAEKELERNREESAAIERQLSETKAQRDLILAEIEADYQDERLQHENSLRKMEETLRLEYEVVEELHTKELAHLHEKLGEARSYSDKEMEHLMNQIERLRQYVRTKADPLLHLDFITQAQYDEILGVTAKGDEETKDWPNFESIDGGYPAIISHVQSFLYYQRRIVYPRALLENFFALLCTGDLIILSGLSGSGKTQLVKSFAKATGNIAHIIPVKPNWTSSEDLLGYYNPLQRSYLTTQFLDALIAAQRDPDRLHLICLDEMNLARVEYYFADFLSVLEERTETPTITLYSAEEAGHVETEFRLFVDVLLKAAEGRELRRFGDFLDHKDIVQQLQDRLGIQDGESVLQLHSRLRRMVAGVLNVPPILSIPSNIRIIGAVNIDDTTHYLSPKVLDRAQVLQFQSPLNYWELVDEEIAGEEILGTGVCVPASQFGRGEYPGFNPGSQDIVASTMVRWATDYLAPIGIEIGVRVIRQSLLYRDRLSEVTQSEDVDQMALNHLVRQKLLPRFSFDGKRAPQGREGDCSGVVSAFQRDIASLPDFEPFNAKRELAEIISRANRNDKIFNYWA
ncbi:MULTISPECIES: McrB family protein [unclassified Thiocapsa]|uniref:McrB family protein n=1 Tax=unclassified Thiocapsa TaxID=2641286 RepID=UPI0035B0B7F1